MSRHTLLGLVVLLVILGIVVWAVSWPKSNNEINPPVLSVRAFNQTQNKDAQSVSAVPQDVIIYSLTAENQTEKIVSGYVVEVNISQISDKSILIDAQGASYNSATSSLVWTPLDIPANGSIQKQFSVRINPLPAGSTNSVMKIQFNNQLDVSLTAPKVAGADTGNQSNPAAPYKAPTTGSGTDLIWILAFLSMLGAFFVRKNYKTGKI